MFNIAYSAINSYCMVIDDKPQDKKNIHTVAINNHTVPHTEKCN